MAAFEKFEITGSKAAELKTWLANQEGLVPVEPKAPSSLLTCYSLLREVGGPNDELARFIFDEDSGRIADKRALKAEVGRFDGSYAVAISSGASSRLSIRVPQLARMIHYHAGAVIISTSSIIAQVKKQNLQPVIVRDWLLRSLFSDFDPQTMSYRDQLWVLRHNEVGLYADIVASGKVIFQELHDVTAHLSGIEESGYRFAGEVAGRVSRKMSSYFGHARRGNLPSHLVPFLIGVILDGLTQVTLYRSAPRTLAIDALLKAMDEFPVEPRAKVQLKGFPKGIDVINGLFQTGRDFTEDRLHAAIQSLLRECAGLIQGVQV